VDQNTDSGKNDASESVTEEDLTSEEETATEEATEEETTEEEEPEEQPEAEEITINVYYSDQMAEYLIAESRIISSENKYVDTLYELMKKPIDSALTPLVPDTTIINSVTIEEGNAKVDFSQDFLDDRFASDTVDRLLVGSIANTLTQFSEINSVTLYIDGEKLDNLGGLDIQEPVFRQNDLIKDN
jgi:spore germination protein GerM